MIDLDDVAQRAGFYDLNEVHDGFQPRRHHAGSRQASMIGLAVAGAVGLASSRYATNWSMQLRGQHAGCRDAAICNGQRQPIDLIHHGTGLTPPALFEEAARRARLDRPAPPSSTTPAKVDHSHEIARILADCTPLSGSVAEVYLQSRGLSDPASPDLLFNVSLADFETRRGWPGMVARIRNGAGEPTGGIHRTYLLDDGSGKAPPGKKMLGRHCRGFGRLAPIGDGRSSRHRRGHRDGARRDTMFGVPTWAALSADGVASLGMAGGIKPRDDLCRCWRGRHAGRAVLADRLEYRRHRE